MTSPSPIVLAVTLLKGGTGKTSTTAHVAALAAERGYKVLVVDTDPQGNLGLDLGYAGGDSDDQGESLCEAVMFNRPLRVIRDVRPGLDAIVGGPKVEMLAYVPTDTPEERMLGLRRVLEPIWEAYDLVVIDTPPLIRPLREMALAASDFVIIPTKGDDGSISGVTGIAQDFTRVRSVNPSLQLLGVVLFGIGSSSKNIRSTVRDKISAGLGEVAPVFAAEIRHAEAPAVASRNSGVLVHEYATAMGLAEKFTERKKAVSANKLAGDYARLAAEVLTAAASRSEPAAGSRKKVAAR